MENYTKDYLFAILINPKNKEEQDRALKELCNRYDEINYYAIKRLVGC